MARLPKLQLLLCVCLLLCHRSSTAANTVIDQGWLFHQGDAPGAEAATFSDKDWQTVTLPHDWAIHAPFLPTNPSGGAGGFATMGVGWYRKHLRLAPRPAQRYAVRFEGVMANSDAWINGHPLGHRPNGYVSLEYDLTPYLQPGDNVIAVRADNSKQPSSRFYHGAGIYRPVHLLQTGQVHLVSDGVSLVATLADRAATVNIQIEVRNQGSQSAQARTRLRLVSPLGKTLALKSSESLTLGPDSIQTAHVSIPVTSPQLWSLTAPLLYQLSVETVVDGRVTDQRTVPFGIREAKFDAATGFWLNGQNIKIKGAAIHSDGGALGMAVPESVMAHRLLALKGMGANAIRTAHNASPEILDLCDRLGLLVMDEFFDQWLGAKTPYDYHLYFAEWWQRDLRDLVRRDRNHPSVILWSAGNEIRDTAKPDQAKQTLAALVAEFHRNDPSRPVTQALFRPNATHDYDNGLADLLDVVGQNYRPNEILAAHAQNPARKIIGTENIHDRDTWLAVRDHPEYSGMFLWAGADYLGESRAWPQFADTEGMLDRTNFPKPDALERASWWRSDPVIHIARRVAPTTKAPTDPGWQKEAYIPAQVQFPDWTPANRSSHIEAVEVYSNCADVELSLNSKPLGAQHIHADASPRTWNVTFVPGMLRAQCLDHPAINEELRTAGSPARILLQDETPNLTAVRRSASPFGPADVRIIRATILDSAGTPIPGARLPITFTTTGGATLVAVDDASPIYTAPFASPTRPTNDGRLVAYIQASTHPATLRATTPGLPSTEIQIPSTTRR